MKLTKWKALTASGAALAIAGGGAAIAATQFGPPQQESQAAVEDAAQQLGIAPSKLRAALKKALENRVDAAVAAGRLTKAQGDALKQRIEAGDVPLLDVDGDRHGFGHGRFHALDAAVRYLGLTEAQLQAQLRSGKTLAAIAKAEGKSVDGLVAALVADAKQHLDADVAAGRLTQAQEQQLLSHLQQRVTAFVNGVQPPFGFRDHDGDGDGDGPPHR